MRTLSKYKIIVLFLLSCFANSLYAGQKIKIETNNQKVVLSIGSIHYFFTQQGKMWALSHIQAGNQKIVSPINKSESFFSGSGDASNLTIIENNSKEVKVCFSGFENYPLAKIFYTIKAEDLLPRLNVRIEGIEELTCTYRSLKNHAKPHGSWITRGEMVADAEEREVFIDGSGPFVFGHSIMGDNDIAYVWQAKVKPNVPQGKTQQKSDTYFKSGIKTDNNGQSFTYWQLRIGKNEPKEYAMIWDYNLGGRIHDVFEKYYSDVVDSQVDFKSYKRNYNATRAIEKMPVRLSSPESFVPGYGWVMHEYYPNGQKAAYPFTTECGIQTAALLSYEGLVTNRNWEKNFGLYIINHLPMWSDSDQGYFVKRRGGYTRWGYSHDYKNPFPFQEGGNWGAAEQIYLMARIGNDKTLKDKAISLMKHDVEVKLDLDNFFFPPCWNPNSEKLTDHRDDWFITAGLGYCAVICGEILYPQTQDKKYIEIADKLTDWLASYWEPENKMNYLHPNVNTLHCFSGWLIKAMVQRYERSKEIRFLDIAKDLTWGLAMTLCITDHLYDDGKTPLFAITCVGARGCVDYDCSPHLCHEKDLAFIESMGGLMKHVSGSAYSKYLSMQALMLPKDSWRSAWTQDQKDVNLRTNYDNWARGLTNLAFGINPSSNLHIQTFDQTVANRSLNINHERDITIINATSSKQEAQISIPHLKTGTYQLYHNGKPWKKSTAHVLQEGIVLSVPANTTVKLAVKAKNILNENNLSEKGRKSILLSDLTPFEAQRGVGNPQPVYQTNRTFLGNSLQIGNHSYQYGLGLAANTVLFYRLDKKYTSLKATLALDNEALKLNNPYPSVNVTLFTDGKLCFESGKLDQNSAPLDIEIPLSGIEVLTLRVSSNFDDDGDLKHDRINLINPYLIP